MSKFDFQPLNPARPWRGRYSRIPGKEPSFHVAANNTITAVWYNHQDDERLTARLVESPAAIDLAKALNSAKIQHSGSAGGSFLINEFCQVISPIRQSNDRYWVGNIKGLLQFRHPVTGQDFDLGPKRNLTTGDPWPGPYIGMKFNLSNNNRIYFAHEEDNCRTRLEPPVQDSTLIRQLREVRAIGAVRFIVNLHGVVITKVEHPDGSWRPHYVGVVDFHNWYSEEP
jgi:hypothetical protein